MLYVWVQGSEEVKKNGKAGFKDTGSNFDWLQTEERKTVTKSEDFDESLLLQKIERG